MTPNVPHFIQGFFGQELETLGVHMMPIDGAVAVFDTVNTTQMFAGLIFPGGVTWEGHMYDVYGTSALTGVSLTEDSLDFTKCYKGRRDVIDYTFTRVGSIWIGYFSGTVVETGPAVCTVVPVPGEMLKPAV